MKRIVAIVLGVPLLALLWLLLAPSQIGGSLSYVVTTGNSMEPRIETGDIVFVKKQASYKVGDAVAFRDPQLNTVVFHRIVQEAGETFITKGDNNDFLDTYQPRADELIGKELFMIAGGGKFVDPIRSPIGMSLASAVGLALLVFGWVRKNRAGAQPVMVRARLQGVSEHRTAALAILAVPLAFFLGLGAIAASTPTQVKKEHVVSVEHKGRFTYEAEAAGSAAYDSRKVTTGQPLFLRLVDEAVLNFRYELSGAPAENVSGKIDLDATISDPASGWSKTVNLASTSNFTGPTASAEAALDLEKLQKELTLVERQTGVERSQYRITVGAHVRVAGDVEGVPFESKMDAPVPMQLDDFQLHVLGTESPTGEKVDPFVAKATEDVSYQAEGPNRVGFGPLSLPVPSARLAGTVGGLLSVILIGLALVLVPRPDTDEVARIESRHSNVLVRVRPGISKGRRTIDVESFEELLALADAYEKMILHERSGSLNRYLVDDGSVFYRFETRSSRQPTRAVSPIEPEELLASDDLHRFVVSDDEFVVPEEDMGLEEVRA